MTRCGKARAGLRLLACGSALGFAAPVAGAQGLAPFDSRAIGGWRLSAGVGEQWESNVLFTSTAPETELTTRARAEGARLWLTPSDRVNVAGSVTRIHFRELTELDRTSYDGTLHALHDFGPRTSGTLDYRGSSDLTSRTLTAGGEGGLVRGLVAARTHDVSGSLARRVSRSLTTRLGAEYQSVAFDTPGLLGGELAAASLQLNQVQGRASRLSTTYDFRRSRSAGLTLDGQTLDAAWDHRLTRYLGAQLRAGAARYTIERSPRGGTRFVGGGLLRLHDQTTDWIVEVQRNVGQEFGLDQNLLLDRVAVSTIDVASLRYQRILADRLRLSWSFLHAWSEAARAPVRSARSAEAFADARYEVRRGLAVAVGGFYRRRDDVSIYVNRGVTLGVGYAWSQVRSMPPAPQPEVH